MFYSQPSLVVAHKEKGCEFESTQIQNILCKVCHFYFHLGWTFRSLFYHQHWSDAPRSHHMNEPWKTNQWSPSNRTNLHLLRFSQSNSSYFETQRHPEFKRWPLQEKLSKYIWQILQILWDSWSIISLGRFQIQFSVLNFTGLLLQ